MPRVYVENTAVNVCGLRTRTIYPEFYEFLSKYDFIGLQETKTDSLDNIQIPGYNIHFKHLYRRNTVNLTMQNHRQWRITHKDIAEFLES